MSRQFRFLLVLLLTSFCGTSGLFYLYESGSNPHVHSYGDIYPMSTGARFAGVVAILVGIYCYTNFVTLAAESLNDFVNRARFGNAPLKGGDHVVICEYTAFADEMIQVLDRYPEPAKRAAVMVTDLVSVQP